MKRLKGFRTAITWPAATCVYSSTEHGVETIHATDRRRLHLYTRYELRAGRTYVASENTALDIERRQITCDRSGADIFLGSINQSIVSQLKHIYPERTSLSPSEPEAQRIVRI